MTTTIGAISRADPRRARPNTPPVLVKTASVMSNLWNNNLKPLFTEISDFVQTVFTGGAGQGAQQIADFIGLLWSMLSPLGRLKLVMESLGVDFGGVVDGVTRFFAALNDGATVGEAFVATFGESSEVSGISKVFADIGNFGGGKLFFI